MKKILSFLLIIFTLFTLVGCKPKVPETPDGGGDQVELPKEDNKIHLIVLAGQSGARGKALVNDLKGANAQKVQMEIGGINKKFKLGYTNPSVNDVAAWIEKLG